MLNTSLRTHHRTVQKTPFTITKHAKHKGTSLVEVIVTVSITAILSSIAVPNFSEYIVTMRVDNEISRLSRLLFLARNYSINSGLNVIICPLESTGVCSDKWHKELSVFIDINGNQQFDGNNELLIEKKEPINLNDTLIYGKGRTKITYQPTGHLYGLANGTFKYCPKDYTDRARGIVVARSGRFYKTTDSNSDGIDETRSNKKITCN